MTITKEMRDFILASMRWFVNFCHYCLLSRNPVAVAIENRGSFLVKNKLGSKHETRAMHFGKGF